MHVAEVLARHDLGATPGRSRGLEQIDHVPAHCVDLGGGSGHRAEHHPHPAILARVVTPATPQADDPLVAGRDRGQPGVGLVPPVRTRLERPLQVGCDDLELPDVEPAVRAGAGYISRRQLRKAGPRFAWCIGICGAGGNRRQRSNVGDGIGGLGVSGVGVCGVGLGVSGVGVCGVGFGVGGAGGGRRRPERAVIRAGLLGRLGASFGFGPHRPGRIQECLLPRPARGRDLRHHHQLRALLRHDFGHRSRDLAHSVEPAQHRAVEPDRRLGTGAEPLLCAPDLEYVGPRSDRRTGRSVDVVDPPVAGIPRRADPGGGRRSGGLQRFPAEQLVELGAGRVQPDPQHRKARWIVLQHDVERARRSDVDVPVPSPTDLAYRRAEWRERVRFGGEQQPGAGDDQRVTGGRQPGQIRQQGGEGLPVLDRVAGQLQRGTDLVVEGELGAHAVSAQGPADDLVLAEHPAELAAIGRRAVEQVQVRPGGRA
ncbi:MAG: hypothetical protein DLM56_13430 [Pseudonocardiales bacterium]|nr:MAG: hypothetical protein DLM56_13430 [Pseudonocardiales bacterium]